MDENQNINPPVIENKRMVTDPEPGSVGAMIGLFIILAVIILGGLYFLGQRMEMLKTTNTGNDQATTTSEVADDLSSIQTQSSSDDTASIEADLNSTQTEGLDSELNSI